MIVSRGETYLLKVYPRKEDSPYEYEGNPYVFYGRPASQLEKKNYRIQQGVEGNSDGVFIYASNMPSSVKIGDKVEFMGKHWTIQSIGFYFDSSLIVNAGIMSDKYIEERSPKGVSLQ